MSDPFDGPSAVSKRRATSNGDPEGLERDQWNRPRVLDPLDGKVKGMTRASGLGSVLADFFNLTAWQLRMAAKGLTIGADDLLKLASVTDLDERDTWKDEIIEPALDRAGANAGRRKGTALHTAGHNVDRGERIADQPLWTHEHLIAYGAELERQGVEVDPRFIECFVVAPEVMSAGSFDELLRAPSRADWSGLCRIGDKKTQQHHPREFNALEIAVQLAVYAHGLHDHGLWVPGRPGSGGSYQPLPEGIEIDLKVAVVTWLPVIGEHAGECHLVEIDIEWGWQMARKAAMIKEDRKEAKRRTRDMVPPTAQALTGDEPVGTTVTVGGIEFTKHSPTDSVASVFGQSSAAEKIDEAFKPDAAVPGGTTRKRRRTPVEVAAARALAEMRKAGCNCPGDDHLGVLDGGSQPGCPYHDPEGDGSVKPPEMPSHGDKADWVPVDRVILNSDGTETVIILNSDGTETVIIREPVAGHHVHQALQDAGEKIDGPGIRAVSGVNPPSAETIEAARVAAIDELSAMRAKREGRTETPAVVDPIIAIRAQIMKAKTPDDLSAIWRANEAVWIPELTALGKNVIRRATAGAS